MVSIIFLIFQCLQELSSLCHRTFNAYFSTSVGVHPFDIGIVIYTYVFANQNLLSLSGNYHVVIIYPLLFTVTVSDYWVRQYQFINQGSL